MRVTSGHVSAFLEMSQTLDNISKQAKPGSKNDPRDDSIDGPLTKTQLELVVPGFFRVEVLQPTSESQNKLDDIPVDLVFDNQRRTVDPTVCCGKDVKPEQVMTWEVGIKGFSVRRFPDPIGWVALLPGTKEKKTGQTIGHYWSGEYNNLDKRTGADGKYFGQQAGFMATRSQIKRFTENCPSGFFLPPFEQRDDGLAGKNVEYWSGGYQLFGGGVAGCNFQRILPLKPELFSRQLLYHTSNNKQKQISQNRLLLVENLLGQLNAVKKRAEQKIKNR